LGQAASVATLPSALLVERFSLGASLVFSIQQVVLSGKRPPLPKGDYVCSQQKKNGLTNSRKSDSESQRKVIAAHGRLRA